MERLNRAFFERPTLTVAADLIGKSLFFKGREAIITETEGFPAAVLIRGVRIRDIPDKKLNGPGKLCRFLGITREHNKIDLTQAEDFFVADSGLRLSFRTTPRIGISAGADKPWRFVV